MDCSIEDVFALGCVEDGQLFAVEVDAAGVVEQIGFDGPVRATHEAGGSEGIADAGYQGGKLFGGT